MTFDKPKVPAVKDSAEPVDPTEAELVQHRDEPGPAYQTYVDSLVKYLTQTFRQIHELAAAKDLERGCDSLEGPLREGDYVLMRKPVTAVAKEGLARGMQDESAERESREECRRGW